MPIQRREEQALRRRGRRQTTRGLADDIVACLAYTYDAGVNRTRAATGGQMTTTMHDGLTDDVSGRVQTVTDPEGQVTTYTCARRCGTSMRTRTRRDVSISSGLDMEMRWLPDRARQCRSRPALEAEHFSAVIGRTEAVLVLRDPIHALGASRHGGEGGPRSRALRAPSDGWHGRGVRVSGLGGEPPESEGVPDRGDRPAGPDAHLHLRFEHPAGRRDRRDRAGHDAGLRGSSRSPAPHDRHRSLRSNGGDEL